MSTKLATHTSNPTNISLVTSPNIHYNNTSLIAPASPSLTDNYTYSYMNNELNMNVMDLNAVNMIDLSAVEGMWVNVMNS